MEVDGAGSGSCLMESFGISGVQISGLATRQLTSQSVTMRLTAVDANGMLSLPEVATVVGSSRGSHGAVSWGLRISKATRLQMRGRGKVKSQRQRGVNALRGKNEKHLE
jgi:hypothetical protein